MRLGTTQNPAAADSLQKLQQDVDDTKEIMVGGLLGRGCEGGLRVKEKMCVNVNRIKDKFVGVKALKTVRVDVRILRTVCVDVGGLTNVSMDVSFEECVYESLEECVRGWDKVEGHVSIKY